MKPLEIHSQNLEDTRRAAEILLEKITKDSAGVSASMSVSIDARVGACKRVANATVVGLYGDLGAGKTAFTQFFGELLGVREKISSPTFVLEKIYKIENSTDGKISSVVGSKIFGGDFFPRTFSHLIHIDAYRLESEKEMESLGWKEIVGNPRNIILVEWPERIAGLMPKNHIRIYFEHVDGEGGVVNENARKITFAGKNKNVTK